jgi:hypothetical protein
LANKKPVEVGQFLAEKPIRRLDPETGYSGIESLKMFEIHQLN